jgi:hypothetical protein
MRTVLEKSTHRDAQGVAALSLAQYLKNMAEAAQQMKDQPELVQRVESMYGKDRAKQMLETGPEGFAKEAESLFERVESKYADVKHSYKGTLGDSAKAELFEIRNLAIGKSAPEIEGEDIQGQKFKLSDYKGKVVVLDFWGNW